MSLPKPYRDDSYWMNAFIALDEFVNAVILLGSPHETISSRAYRAQQDGKRWGKIIVPVIDALFQAVGHHRHCENAYRYILLRSEVR